MTVSFLPDVPADLLRGLDAPLAAVVALARRLGADGFPFASSGFDTALFQKALLARAEELSVLGLILVELDRTGRLRGMRSGAGLAADHLRRARRQAAMWDLERDSVLLRLERAGIPVLLLKGAALRVTSYRDSAERAFGDIDVLVPKESLAAAVAALAELGYAPETEDRVRLYLEHYHHLILSKPDGFVVEVHWALVPVMSPLQLDSAAFWRDSRTLNRPGGVRTVVPSAHHMVLHLAQQNMEDGFSQLRRLVDIDRVISATADFDWDRLSIESKRMRVQAVVALALQLAQVLLGTAVPRGFVTGLGISSVARMHLALLDPVALVLERRARRRAVQDLLTVWCLPDFAARMRALKAMWTGDQERLWHRLGWFRNDVGTAIASLLKLAGYQAMLYPTLIVDRKSVV